VSLTIIPKIELTNFINRLVQRRDNVATDD